MLDLGSFRTRLLQDLQAFRIEPVGCFIRISVPALSRFVAFEAWTSIWILSEGRFTLSDFDLTNDQQRLYSRCMKAIERLAHVASEAQPSHYRFGTCTTHMIQYSDHVGYGVGFTVGILVIWVRRPAVAAHIPDDQFVACLRESIDLSMPHARCRGVTVSKQQRRSISMCLVVDSRPTFSFDVRHCSQMLICWTCVATLRVLGPVMKRLDIIFQMCLGNSTSKRGGRLKRQEDAIVQGSGLPTTYCTYHTDRFRAR
jgi:hypothetical protein